MLYTFLLEWLSCFLLQGLPLQTFPIFHSEQWLPSTVLQRISSKTRKCTLLFLDLKKNKTLLEMHHDKLLCLQFTYLICFSFYIINLMPYSCIIIKKLFNFDVSKKQIIAVLNSGMWNLKILRSTPDSLKIFENQ